jgi:CyaY protein
MTDSEFYALAKQTLDTIETAVEHIVQTSDDDIDAARNGEVLSLTFENGTKIVINSQAPLQQLWMAAKSGGYHYAWNGSAWMDTRTGGELFAMLSSIASEQAGHALRFQS